MLKNKATEAIPVVHSAKFGSKPAPFTNGLLTIEQLFLLMYPIFLIPAILSWWFYIQRSRRYEQAPDRCRKIGIDDPSKSNIKDEYEEKDGSQPQWRVKALFIYPVKSCAPVELQSSDVEGRGVKFDRQFAFAEYIRPQTRLDAPEEEKRARWTFRTQRDPKYQKLALVRPEIWLPTSSGTTEKEGVLIIKYPNVPRGFMAWLDYVAMKYGLVGIERSFRVPLYPPQGHSYPQENVVIWKNELCWLNYGKHVPDDFKVFLGTSNPLSLFRVDPEVHRDVFRCAPRVEELGYQANTGFADAYPVHLLNNASVRDVARRVKKDIPRFSARRYRCNVLIQGPRAFEEDDWKKMRIGEHMLYCVCHTVRCRLPNVDPDTGLKHDVEPDKTLKSYRCIDDGDPKNACLGLQLVPGKETGIHLKVGDTVEVLERGEHHYIRQ